MLDHTQNILEQEESEIKAKNLYTKPEKRDKPVKNYKYDIFYCFYHEIVFKFDDFLRLKAL